MIMIMRMVNKKVVGLQTKTKRRKCRSLTTSKPPVHLHHCSNKKMRVGGGRDSRRASKQQRERERRADKLRTKTRRKLGNGNRRH